MLMLAVSAHAQQCANLGVFNQCVNEGGLRLAACSTAVKNTPDITYYECQCTEYTKQLHCYHQCPDDPNLQLQYLTTQSSVNSICQAVEMMKKQGNTKTAQSSTKPATTTKPPPATTTVSKNNGGNHGSTTSGGGSITTVTESPEETTPPTQTPFSGLTSTSGANRKVNVDLFMFWGSLGLCCLFYALM